MKLKFMCIACIYMLAVLIAVNVFIAHIQQPGHQANANREMRYTYIDIEFLYICIDIHISKSVFKNGVCSYWSCCDTSDNIFNVQANGKTLPNTETKNQNQC